MASVRGSAAADKGGSDVLEATEEDRKPKNEGTSKRKDEDASKPWYKRCPPRLSTQTWIKISVAIFIIGGLIAVAIVFRKQLIDILGRFFEWVKKIGIWGPVCMAAIYAVATVFFFPGLILTLGAGFAFGLLWGTVCVVVGSNAGACIAFLLGRFLLREWVVSLAKGYPVFAALDAAIAVREVPLRTPEFIDQSNGWLLVILIRLSPVIPFNIVNYVLGITGVPLHVYALCSFAAMLPATVLFVYVGSAIKNVSQILSGKYQGTVLTKVFFYVGLALAAVTVVLISWIAGRAVRRVLREQEEALAAKNTEGATDSLSVNATTPSDTQPLLQSAST